MSSHYGHCLNATTSLRGAGRCTAAPRKPQSAEDVLQETYIRVLEGRACFKGQSGFRTWLFGVVRFVALEHGMRETRIENRIVALSDDAIGESRVAQTETATYSTTVSDTSSMLSVALAELPERQREVLHLMFYQEMSIAEAAVAMGVELGTARTHYKRGEKTMKEKLE